MSLCEALHGQLTGEEGEGGERAQLGGAMGVARGRHGVGLQALLPARYFLYAWRRNVRRRTEHEEEEMEEREKKKKRKEKKRKKNKKIWKIF
jgi:hypothetical protein